ncbi:hypothetical protein OF83DRAFT_129260 [Amylostereum chailletii]|nr:hypothetical protein OF83DRAFT_129260 [Amylostereum chailletii]
MNPTESWVPDIEDILRNHEGDTLKRVGTPPQETSAIFGSKIEGFRSTKDRVHCRTRHILRPKDDICSLKQPETCPCQPPQVEDWLQYLFVRRRRPAARLTTSNVLFICV